MRRKRTYTDFQLHFWFSITVLTHTFSWNPSSNVCVWVWETFSEHTPKWGPQFSAVFTSSCLVSDWLFLPRRQLLMPLILSLLQPMKTCCPIVADPFLFFNLGAYCYCSWGFREPNFLPLIRFSFFMCFFLFRHLLLDM